MNPHYAAGAATGKYNVHHDNQLHPGNTFVGHGADDVLDERFSPPELPGGGLGVARRF
jgi:hypothetical protein